MLAMAHVAGGDAMIACFDAKYPTGSGGPTRRSRGRTRTGTTKTEADPTWQPLRATPNFPEYPSAHACHTDAVAEALQAFFGTDKVRSRSTVASPARLAAIHRFSDVVQDVNRARVLVGFHFRNSDQDGSALGRRVARYVVRHRFRQLE